MHGKFTFIELAIVIGSCISAAVIHAHVLKEMLALEPLLPLWAYSVLYFLGPAILAGGFMLLKRKERSLFSVLSLFFGVLLPLAGVLSVTAIFFYRMLGDRTKELFYEDTQEQYEDVFEDEEIIRKAIKENEEETLRRQIDAESFSDILMSKNGNLKRDAIEKLAMLDNKESIYLLKRTLVKDPDAEMRFFAGNALKKVEEGFQNQIQALNDNIQQNPAGFENYFKLARLYLRLFRAELSGDSIQHFCLLQATDAITSALNIEPNNIEALIEAGKIKIAQRAYKEALEYLEKAEKIEPTSWQVLIWRCEADFFLGNFQAIKKACKVIVQENPPWKLVNNVTHFWLNNA